MGILAACAAMAVAGCGGSSGSASNDSTATASTAATGLSGPNGIEPVDALRGPEPAVTVPKGPPPTKIIVRELKEGTGTEAKTGDLVTIQFNAIFFNGKHFESSWEFGKAFRFKLGADKVSPGWEKGIPGMKEGGRYKLIVPWTRISHFGIPPGTDPTDAEIYVLDLLEVSESA
jgi:FKBP-type peptidyl-prolyl cis-trans isomerase